VSPRNEFEVVAQSLLESKLSSLPQPLVPDQGGVLLPVVGTDGLNGTPLHGAPVDSQWPELKRVATDVIEEVLAGIAAHAPGPPSSPGLFLLSPPVLLPGGARPPEAGSQPAEHGTQSAVQSPAAQINAGTAAAQLVLFRVAPAGDGSLMVVSPASAGGETGAGDTTPPPAAPAAPPAALVAGEQQPVARPAVSLADALTFIADLPVGAPLVGVVPVDLAAIETGAAEFLGHLTVFDADLPETMARPDVIAALAAAAVFAGGVGYAAVVCPPRRRAYGAVPGPDSVLARWEGKHEGRAG